MQEHLYTMGLALVVVGLPFVLLLGLRLIRRKREDAPIAAAASERSRLHARTTHQNRTRITSGTSRQRDRRSDDGVMNAAVLGSVLNSNDDSNSSSHSSSSHSSSSHSSSSHSYGGHSSFDGGGSSFSGGDGGGGSF